MKPHAAEREANVDPDFLPAYRKLHRTGELKKRGEKLWSMMERCMLCPRHAGAEDEGRCDLGCLALHRPRCRSPGRSGLNRDSAVAAPGQVVRTLPFPSLQSGSVRSLVIGLLAAVVGGGILLAARAMDVDREVHRRYDHAHPFVELALEASQLGAQLHELQAAGVSAGAILSSARTTLLDAVARLESALKRVGELDPTAEERAVARELDRVVVSTRSTLQDSTGRTPHRLPGTVTLPTALVEQAEAIERLLPRLNAMARARTAQYHCPS